MKKIRKKYDHDSSSFWNWICRRILSLAIGSIIIIAFIMWLRFYIENKWYEYHMPEGVRSELSELIKNPKINITRYHEIIDKWYGVSYSDPRMGVIDWIILAILVLIFVPVIFVMSLNAARPVSKQISRLAYAARAVAKGGFGIKVPVIEDLPHELKSLSENFNEMSTRLEHYERELKKSHVVMAHELRSPLTAAIGRLQGILDEVFEPDAKQLNMILKQLKVLNRLVDDLHLLKLADAGQLKISIQKINIENIISEKIVWITPAAEKVGMKIIHHKKNLPLCKGDPERLGQVFIIIMDNALKYAADGEILEISYNVNPKNITILFRDNGPGVDDECLSEIFSPFVREEKSRSRNSGGSGLGLAIAKTICELNNGSIEVAKNNKNGLTFVIQLEAE